MIMKGFKNIGRRGVQAARRQRTRVLVSTLPGRKWLLSHGFRKGADGQWIAPKAEESKGVKNAALRPTAESKAGPREDKGPWARAKGWLKRGRG